MRVSISFYFEWNYYNSNLIGELPLESQTGIISIVANTLNLMKTHYAMVKKVILETIAAKKEGKKLLVTQIKKSQGNKFRYALDINTQIKWVLCNNYKFVQCMHKGTFRSKTHWIYCHI